MAIQFLMLPAMALVQVSRLIATKGVAEATKKFGKNAVRAAKKYFDPVKTQKMKTGPGRGTPGNVKNMEDAFVKFSKPIGKKGKSGLENMSMQKVTKSEGEKLLRKGLARKAGLGTIASVTAGTFAASGGKGKSEKETKQGISGIKDDIKRFNAKRLTNRQSDASRTARPKQFKDIGDKISNTKKEKPKAKPKAGSEIGSSAGSKRKQGIGEKIVNELKGETRRQQSQLNKPKGRAESVKEQLLIQGKREYDTPLGKITVDSTDEGMDTDRANFRSGGSTLKKRYGAREGGFTKRGGMYKKGY